MNSTTRIVASTRKKIVTERIIRVEKTGSMRCVKISLPNILMYRKALEEKT